MTENEQIKKLVEGMKAAQETGQVDDPILVAKNALVSAIFDVADKHDACCNPGVIIESLAVTIAGLIRYTERSPDAGEKALMLAIRVMINAYTIAPDPSK